MVFGKILLGMRRINFAMNLTDHIDRNEIFLYRIVSHSVRGCVELCRRLERMSIAKTLSSNYKFRLNNSILFLRDLKFQCIQPFLADFCKYYIFSRDAINYYFKQWNSMTMRFNDQSIIVRRCLFSMWFVP